VSGLPERDYLHPSQISDPIERVIARALTDADIAFRHGGDGELDFHLPTLGIWIECKRAFTPRVSRQLERHERVILVQSLEAARVLADWIGKANP
jgi:hypothetical protein